MLPPRLRRPGAALAALTTAVLAVHLLAAQWLSDTRLGEGAGRRPPQRMNVAFVRQLAPAAPPPVPAAGAVAAARTARAARAPAPRAAASAAQAGDDEDEGPVMVSAPVLPDFLNPDSPAPPSAAAPASSASAVPAALAQGASPAPPPSNPAASAASAPPAFDWPPSTRLSYRLSGNYRGPVEGRAQVEWLRADGRYQVFMDLGIGPAFAPLMSRRVSSEGLITPQGLAPRRYDEETKVVLLAPRRLAVDMDDGHVRLANGSSVARPAGLQDSASQFVQLTWLFTTQPELLQTGRSIVLPLALPRSVEPWTYDVVGSETLNTPAGAVLAVHVKPRREPKPGGDLTAEIWVAPSLQYLPVRILIRQDNDTWIDLTVDRLPEQAAAGR